MGFGLEHHDKADQESGVDDGGLAGDDVTQLVVVANAAYHLGAVRVVVDADLPCQAGHQQQLAHELEGLDVGAVVRGGVVYLDEESDVLELAQVYLQQRRTALLPVPGQHHCEGALLPRHVADRVYV